MSVRRDTLMRLAIGLPRKVTDSGNDCFRSFRLDVMIGVVDDAQLGALEVSQGLKLHLSPCV